MSNVLTELVAKISVDTAGLKQGLNNAETKLKSFGTSMTSAGRSMSMAFTAPIGALGALSLKGAADFDTAFRKVNVMLGASAEEAKTYKERILEISTATGKSATDVADAFYMIVSAGYRGADSLDILETAMRGVVGGSSETVSTTEALTKAMNIFSLEGVEGANRAMDVFFGIVDTGLLTFEQMSQAFPQAASSAKALGISIEETGAALGTLTKVTGSTDEAATALNNAMMLLIKPSDKMLEAYEQWGVKNGPEAIKKFGGLQGVLVELNNVIGDISKSGLDKELQKQTQHAEDLKDKIYLLQMKMGEYSDKVKESTKVKDAMKLDELQGELESTRNTIAGLVDEQASLGDSTGMTVDQLAELFPSIRAIRGVLPLATTNAEDFKDALDTVGGATGRTGEAFKEMSEGSGFKLQQAMTKIQNAMIKLGDTLVPILVPIIGKVAKVVEKVFNWFDNLPSPVKKVIIVIAGLVAALGPVLIILGMIASGIGSLIGLFGMIGGATVLAPILAVVAAIAGIATVIVLVIKNWDKLWAATKKVFGWIWDLYQSKLGWLLPGGALIKAILFLKDNWSTVWNAIKSVASAVWNAIKRYYETIARPVINGIKRITNALGVAWGAVWNGMKVAFRVVANGIKRIYNNTLKPVIDAIKDGIDTVKDAYETITEPAKKSTSWLTDIVEAPLKVIDELAGTNLVSSKKTTTVNRGIEPEAWNYFQHGGIATKPTMGIVAEAGPEAIIPLDRFNMGTGTVVNINVEGSLISQGDLINTIRNELLKLKARNVTTGL